MPTRDDWRWQLHGLVVAGRWSDSAIGDRWRATFGPLPAAVAGAELAFDLKLVEAVPPAPARPPDFQQAELLAYYLDGPRVTAQFPRYGQLRLNLAESTTAGDLTGAALATYGVFEDLLAIGLSPHLRRRGLFLLHAFAACPPRLTGSARALLICGDIGAGKTTTGLSLLHAGWKLLSNDSPILAEAEGGLQVLAYPGLLSAYPDTLARFPELAPLNTQPGLRQKALFAADAIYPQVWAQSAPPGALVFPQIEARADHALERLPAPDALRMILPNAIEQWDRAMIPPHLALLNRLMQSVPAFRLRLGPDTGSLPDVLHSALNADLPA